MLFEYDIPWSNSGIQWYISISKFHILVSLTFASNRLFFFFCNRFSRNPPSSSPTSTTRTATTHPQSPVPVMETKDAQRQAVSFLKGSIPYLHRQKFRIFTKKLQHWYKHILNLFSEKQRTFFSWCPQKCSKTYSVLFPSPFSLQGICSFFFFFLFPHLVTLDIIKQK